MISLINPKTRFRWLVVLSALPVLLLVGCGGEKGGTSRSESQPSSDAELLSEGEDLFGQTCAACHGADLKGTTTGPPFLDPIYAPNHHPDEAFYAAAANGVQPHHWDFGPMPAQPSVSEEEVAEIIAYIRSKQAEAGITDDPAHP